VNSLALRGTRTLVKRLKKTNDRPSVSVGVPSLISVGVPVGATAASSVLTSTPAVEVAKGVTEVPKPEPSLCDEDHILVPEAATVEGMAQQFLACSEDGENRVELLLNILEQMGFEGRQRNLECLQKNNFNVKLAMVELTMFDVLNQG